MMKIFFTGRHFEVTKAIRDFASEKLKSNLRFLDDVIEVHIVLSIEKYRHIAEITVSCRKATFIGKEETQDMYSSISGALEKIQKQAKRRKKKFASRKRKSRSSESGAEAEQFAVEPSERERATSRIIREEGHPVKPMTVEEAVLQLEHGGKGLLVFTNSSSKKINVVYRRKNGDYGLIESE